jgi:hypothetical protein
MGIYPVYMTGLNLAGYFPSFLTLFDPGWQQVMIDRVSRSEFSPEALILALGFFGTFALFIVFGMVVDIDFRKKTEEQPLTWIVDQAAIMDILRQAVRQRSKIRISFQREDKNAKSTDATLVEASELGLVLDLTSLSTLNHHWVGKRIDCDFRLRPDPKQELQVFYNFTVAIANLSKTPEEYIRLNTLLPVRLEQEQKRAFLRIEPPTKLIRGLSFWREDQVRAHGRPSDPNSWGTPALFLDPDAPDQLDLKDISAGGMRLDIKPETFKAVRRAFETAGRYFVILDIADPDTAGTLRFHLLARIQNSYASDEAAGSRAFGIRFLANGSPTDDPPHLLSWKPSAGSGIRDLDDWVFNRHLDLYRSKGM